MSAMIRRNFVALDTVSLRILYRSIVCSHLEYDNIVWHPRYKGDDEKEEQVRCRATKMIPRLAGKSYADRLRVLKILILYYKRVGVT